MPFKSQAQARKLAVMTALGQFPKKKFEEWANATKNFKKLPERSSKNKVVISGKGKTK